MDKEQAATQQEIEKINLDRMELRKQLAQRDKIIVDQSDAIIKTREQIRAVQDILKELTEV